MQHIVHKDRVYDVTACDDTKIRRTVLTGVDLATDKQALEGAELGYPEGTNDMFVKAGWPDKIYVIKKNNDKAS